MRPPEPGDMCFDKRGRHFYVEVVDPEDGKDRHVQGKLISRPGAEPVAFATSMKIFEGTWSYAE